MKEDKVNEPMMEHLDDLVRRAVAGNKNALEGVVKAIQDKVYNLALRMLWHPEDAKDATQEILIKIVTRLSSFKHQSKFETWVYRIASNETLNFKAKHNRHVEGFGHFANQLQQGLDQGIIRGVNQAEHALMVQEAKIGCSTAMLQCMNRESRLTYILGEIIEFNSREVGAILGVKPETVRKRLSRSRKQVKAFVQGNCGLVNPERPCRCAKKVNYALQAGMINPNHLLFAGKPSLRLMEAIDQIDNEVALFQSNPAYKAPRKLYRAVRQVVDKKGF